MAIKKSKITTSAIKPLKIDFININLVKLVENEINQQIIRDRNKNQHVKITLSKYFRDSALFNDLISLYLEAGWNVYTDQTNKEEYIMVLS